TPPKITRRGRRADHRRRAFYHASCHPPGRLLARIAPCGCESRFTITRRDRFTYLKHAGTGSRPDRGDLWQVHLLLVEARMKSSTGLLIVSVLPFAALGTSSSGCSSPPDPVGSGTTSGETVASSASVGSGGSSSASTSTTATARRFPSPRRTS